jgi:hypothetical protein
VREETVQTLALVAVGGLLAMSGMAITGLWWPQWRQHRRRRTVAKQRRLSRGDPKGYIDLDREIRSRLRELETMAKLDIHYEGCDRVTCGCRWRTSTERPER